MVARMKKKLCLLVLTTGLTLGIAAPGQASITLSPELLDFGTFAAKSPPAPVSATLTVTAPEVNDTVAGLSMKTGQRNFFPFASGCGGNAPYTCSINVRYAEESGEIGVLTGTVLVEMGPEEGDPGETKELQVRATVLASVVTPLPPVAAPPATGSPAPKPKPKKKPCKKGKAGKKGKGCGAKKGKGHKKGHKGKGK
jgi:hypothetical protein